MNEKPYRILIQEYKDRRPMSSVYYEQFESVHDAEVKLRALEKDRMWAGCDFRVIQFTNVVGFNELEEIKEARS